MVWGCDVDLEGPLHISELNSRTSRRKDTIKTPEPVVDNAKADSPQKCDCATLFSSEMCRDPSKSTSHPQGTMWWNLVA